jgi:threonine/homoserine/homoserine lactone efflux protein
MTLSALTLCGAAYLIHLGAGVLRSPVPHVEAARADEMPARSPARYVLRGAGVSAFNPKGLHIFLSVLPQFARPAFAWPIPLQLTLLGAVFTLACGLFYIPLGYASDRVLSGGHRCPSHQQDRRSRHGPRRARSRHRALVETLS